MFDKAEAEYSELSDKRRIVEADKAKIEKVSRRPTTGLEMADSMPGSPVHCESPALTCMHVIWRVSAEAAAPQ